MDLDSECYWHASARWPTVVHLVPFHQKGWSFLKKCLAGGTHLSIKKKCLGLIYGLVEKALPIPTLPPHSVCRPPWATYHSTLKPLSNIISRFSCLKSHLSQHMHLRYRLTSHWFLVTRQGTQSSQLTLLHGPALLR